MKKTIKKTNSIQVALAGEFAVLSQLALRGMDANMTLGNTKEVDILVSNPKTGKVFKVEVKTNYRNSRNKPSNSKVHGKTLSGWIMKEKHEKIVKPNLFYCFVNIGKETDEFKFYIVPSNKVARYVKEQHLLWLKTKKKEKKKVKNTGMRIFRIGEKKEKYLIDTPYKEDYENNWSLITGN